MKARLWMRWHYICDDDYAVHLELLARFGVKYTDVAIQTTILIDRMKNVTNIKR